MCFDVESPGAMATPEPREDESPEDELLDLLTCHRSAPCLQDGLSSLRGCAGYYIQGTIVKVV